eukprot:m.346389 g.346389  ORF g.346389 m.346389 type:complete len:104 (-) comp28961_c0_seq1:96-407(-)
MNRNSRPSNPSKDSTGEVPLDKKDTGSPISTPEKTGKMDRQAKLEDMQERVYLWTEFYDPEPEDDFDIPKRFSTMSTDSRMSDDCSRHRVKFNPKIKVNIIKK